MDSKITTKTTENPIVNTRADRVQPEGQLLEADLARHQREVADAPERPLDRQRRSCSSSVPPVRRVAAAGAVLAAVGPASSVSPR